MMAVMQGLAEVARFGLVDIVSRGCIVVACALLVAALLRGSSAALRHGVWVATFGALAAAPFAARALPQWTIELPKPLATLVETTRSAAPDGTPPVVQRAGPIDDVAETSGAVTSGSRLSPSIRSSSPVRLPDGTAAPPRGRAKAPAGGAVGGAGQVGAAVTTAARPWIAALGLGYLLGCALLFFRLGTHTVLAHGIARRGRPADHELGREIHACSNGLVRDARVLMSDEVAVPMTFGILQPVIVLPSDAVHWPPGRVRAALLHEYAHVERHDAIVQLLVRVLCAVYWPNPLVRIAAHCQRAEQERACDDRTLLAGIAPHEYAHHLIGVARYARVQHRLVSALAITGSGLPGRIRAIMDPRAHRHPPSRWRLVLTASGLVMLLAPIVAVRLQGGDTTTAGSSPVEHLRPDVDVQAMEQARAAWALGEEEDTSAVAPLLASLTATDASVRTVAAWALGEIRNGRATDALIRSLETDPDPIVREIAALALGEIRDARAAPALAAAIAQTDGPHSAASWALRRIRVTARSGSLLQQPPPDVEPWLDLDREPLPFPSAVGPRLPFNAAIDALDSTDATVRAHAAWSLGMVGDSAAVRPLIPRLRDTDPTVRAVAVWALDEINPSRSSTRD